MKLKPLRMISLRVGTIAAGGRPPQLPLDRSTPKSGARSPPVLLSALLGRVLVPPSFGLFDGLDGEDFEFGGQIAQSGGVVEPGLGEYVAARFFRVTGCRLSVGSHRRPEKSSGQDGVQQEVSEFSASLVSSARVRFRAAALAR